MNQPNPNQSTQPQKPNTRTIGLLLLIIPPAALMGTMILYSLIHFAINAAGASLIIASISSVILGFVGMFAALGCLVAVPIGIYLLIKGK